MLGVSQNRQHCFDLPQTHETVDPLTHINQTFDVAIVGGGIFGLWIARQCAAAGLSTCLVDKTKIGSGASGGFLGALMPHMPDRWDAKKQFQFEALCNLPDQIRSLEEETGLSTGYRRTGRVMPIRTEQFLKQIPERQTGSDSYWQPSDPGLRFDLIRQADPNEWLARDAAPLGYTFENLAARVNPRAYVDALTAAVRRSCTVLEDFPVITSDLQAGHLVSGSNNISAGTLVLANGYESFQVLESMTGYSLGTGVKGQAVLLDTNEDPDYPIVYDDGTYVIVHDDGRTAIGSTSTAEWTDPTSPDKTNDVFLKRAIALVPRLADAPIVEWWAGVRPRCQKRDPLLGRLPDNPRVIAATGGFKISFGIAHKIADAIVTLISGKVPAVPETFTIDFHLAQAEKRRNS